MVMTVENDGTVVIKAPKWTRQAKIDRFYKANLKWISDKKLALQKNRHKITVLSSDDIELLKKKAKVIMTRKTDYYSKLMGVKPDSMKITSARKTWGTCIQHKDKYTICFSYRNMFLSDRCQDYIVVHELAHIKYMNHSPRFFAFIEKILPDYREREAEADRFKDFNIYQNNE